MGQIVQIKSISWCWEWIQASRYGVVSHVVPQGQDSAVRILASHGERFGLLLAFEDDLRGTGRAAPSSCYIEQA